MVIARASVDGIGQPLYNFAVVDDIDMKITHVIREKTTLPILPSKFCSMKLSAHQYQSLPTR